MSSVAEILDQLAFDLNDDGGGGDKFVAWTREALRFYLKEAFELVMKNLPDVFNETRVITLRPVTLYHPLCGCDALRMDGVLGESDEHGNVTNLVRPRQDKAALNWTGRACGPDPYKVREYGVSDDGKTVRVWPPVPPGKKAYLAVRCAVIPSRDDDEVPSEVTAAAAQWVLYRAKMVDGESGAGAIQSAYLHLTAWAALMGVEMPNSRRRAARPAQVT